VAFDCPERALDAVRKFHSNDYDIVDVYTPFAVHGMDEAMGLRESKLPIATFWGAVAGLGLGLGMQLWIHARDWPLNIGGKTNVAWQALIPISFETTVLLAAFATIGALFFKGRLFPRKRAGAGVTQPSLRVTDDHFVAVIEESDGGFSMPVFRELCGELGAVEVTESWRIL